MAVTNQTAKKPVKLKYLPSQRFVPVKQISDGIIEMENGDYVHIMEVYPINFRMMGVIEQNNTIAAYAGFLKIAPIYLHFKVMTRPANGNEHIAFMTKQFEKNISSYTDPEVRKYRKASFDQYIDLTNRISRYTAVTRRFFIIFRYEPDEEIGYDYEDIVPAMHATEQQMREYLAACGNVCVKYDDVDEENAAQAEILYTMFNRATETKFQARVNRVVETQMIANGLVPGADPVPDISVKDFIAPRRVNLMHRHWLYIDGTFYAFMMIAADGYPTSVYAAWLDELINFGSGVDVDIFATRQIKSDVQSNLNRTLAFTKSKARETQEFSRNYEAVHNALDSIRFIKDSLAEGNEDFYYFNTMITVYASSVKELRRRLRRVQDLCRSKDMRVLDCTFRYEQAFQSSLCAVRIDPSLNKISSRNVLTSGLASTYPYVAYELSHKDGVVLGVNPANDSLFCPNIFNTAYFQNANMMLLGSSGAGKTFTLGMLMDRFTLRGIQTFLVAPDKGHEFRRICNLLGGQFIKVCAGSPHCINVMDIHPYDDTSDVEIEGENGAYQDDILSKKIQELKVFFSLLIPEMNNVELQALDDVLAVSYSLKGITNNKSVFLDPDKRLLRPVPTLKDVYDQMLSVPVLQNAASVLKTLVTGSARNFNGQTNVDLSNPLIVFDISELQGALKPVGMFLVIDFLMSQIKADRTVNNALIIDEMWQLISENRYAAEYVKDIWKTIRGYGGAAIGATQDINDYFALEDGKYGRAIISASAIKILKKTAPIEAKTIREVMDLTDVEYKQIMRLSRSQGLFCTDIAKMRIEFMPTKFERWGITTDKNDLKKLKEENFDELAM